ncbi:serine hydrolase domain-containing protein [Catenuloplanes indicus]|uniref:CubicO group peptidase (Beta-lactamase class C family) n=1 Tax=Catenuloplanes indicus TaxID=137267 RepID=A0AAE4AVY8_9ACTN|nr:serine hydrolase domain-containing protein [Catenuloplanes indicus]MDQ0364171.1 CubicO group peptidase (beta-lactamase class C family) [Catenuloplanes indicus]
MPRSACGTAAAEYVRGFGVTRTDAPRDVDGDTVFRVASTTKTFTGAAIMRLAEQRRINLDGTVRDYLPGFHTADAAASARVTVRQALNHTGGWLGDLVMLSGGQAVDGFAFYRRDYVVDLPLSGGTEEGIRANFVRAPDGSVRWFRIGGRLYRRGVPTTAADAGRAVPFHRRPKLS